MTKTSGESEPKDKNDNSTGKANKPESEIYKNLNQITMRIIFFLFLLVLGTQIFSQDEKPPTKEEMKADFEQSIREAKQQRDELIAQIAEARKNKEDAESISEMEKQLTTMNQMISMLEKNNPFAKQTTKPVTAPKNTEPAYVSPFTPIKLKQPVAKPTEAQATDQLLWYRGRLIDPNTLITPSGLIVRYNQQLNQIIFQPERRDTPYYNLVNTLAQVRQLRLNYSSGMDGMMNSFFQFPLIEDAYNEYELFKERYYKLAENTFTIGSSGLSLQQYIYNLGNYIQSLPPARAIPPPKRVNDLCVCDYAAGRKKYENDLKDWKDKFFAEENKILEELSIIFGLIQHFRRNNLSLPSTVSLFEENFSNYHIRVLERSNTKLSELANQYPTDVLIEDGLILIWSVVLRHITAMDLAQLRGYNTVRGAIEGTLFRVKTLVFSDIFENYIEDQKRLKNYNKVFDFGLYTAHEFNKSRLEPNYQVNKRLFDTWIKGVEKFNRFKLNIDIDFEYRQEDRDDDDRLLLIGTGVMHSEDVYVSLGRRECQWELYLTDQNHRNRNSGGEEFRIPIKVDGGTLVYYSPIEKTLPYSKPAYMKMVLPTFKINLCGNQSVAMLDVLSYSAADLKIHANDKIDKVYTTQMLKYVNKLLTSAKMTELNATELMATALEMMNMNNSQTAPTTNDAAFNRLKTEHTMNIKKTDLQFKTSTITHNTNTVVPLTKSMQIPMILFDPVITLDNSTDEDNKRYGEEATGKITIKIVHAPR